MKHQLSQPGPRVPRGFTLTELMVSVLVLVVVIIATSKIFGTVASVTNPSPQYSGRMP